MTPSISLPGSPKRCSQCSVRWILIGIRQVHLAMPPRSPGRHLHIVLEQLALVGLDEVTVSTVLPR